MAKPKNTETETAAPMVADNTPKTYVVVREGFRVSNKEYPTFDDPIAVAEKEFWTKVATNHSYGEAVEVVEYNHRIHKTW